MSDKPINWADYPDGIKITISVPLELIPCDVCGQNLARAAGACTMKCPDGEVLARLCSAECYARLRAMVGIEYEEIARRS